LILKNEMVYAVFKKKLTLGARANRETLMLFFVLDLGADNFQVVKEKTNRNVPHLHHHFCGTPQPEFGPSFSIQTH
jgi:hypothetical protein